MQKITFTNLHKRIINFISVVALLFSSMLVYGQGPFPTIVPNTNIGNNDEISSIKTGVFDDANNNGVADVGELIHYSFSVKNTGLSDLTDITIEDPLVNVVGSLASLAPGQVNSTSFTADYPITQADINNGFVENQAIVTACFDSQPVDPAGNCSGKVTYLKLEYLGNVQNAQIKVIEDDGQVIYNDQVQPGEQFEFYGQEGSPPTMGPKIDVYINNVFQIEIHTSCSIPIGIGSVYGDFEVIDGASKNNGPFIPVSGDGCVGEVSDLSDNDNYFQNDPTIVPLIAAPPVARECGCAPFHGDSNFVNPQLISGSPLAVGAVYRFSNVFPGGPLSPVDALIRIEQFDGGASLLDIDVTSSGLQEAFQPRINSTNNNDQSVLFSITFVEGGGNYGNEVLISFFGTPFDIDGDPSGSTREYGEISLPDAYFVSENTALDIFQTATMVKGVARTTFQAPGGDISLDPRFTFSNYFENKSSFTYRIGKVDGNNDRYYSLDMDSANYANPDSVLVTYPVICGNVSDEGGSPLVGVEIDVTGSDGSSVTVTTDSSGNYKVIAAIPEALVNVDYEIRENDLPGYISISDVDGANDNLITRMINLMSTCGNDFVDGVEPVTGWNFECGDDKLVDEYGYNANCNLTTVATIPSPGNIYEYVVEIVYKGSNPGQSLVFTDSANVSHTLFRSVPVGGSSNVWVYRGLITGNTSSVTYNTTSSLSCKLQSLVVYAFRNVPLASSSSGVFTSKSGYNDVQTINVTIPAFSGPRNLVIETPISELTPDGRYLLLKAESGGVSEQIFIYGPDASLPGGTCCLAIPTLTLNAVPGAATTVTITVDTRNGQNGQSVNGQSWVIASGVNVDGDCYEELEITLEDQQDILCNGDATGSITVAATGGLPPLMYTLNGGTPQSNPVFNGLIAGSYTVAVTDSLGNTASLSVTLNEPPAISIQITKINATETGGCANGQATATPSGGTPPFTYVWSASAGNQTTQTATNLPSGAHTVVVTDANNCFLEQGVIIDCVPDCDAVITVDNITNVLCTNEMTGSATVSASSVANPSATFTFTWNTGDVDAGVTTSTLNNIGAGVYTVSVTIDGTLCLPVEQSVTITEPTNALNVTASATDESGPTTGDGTATASPSGGTPPYTYSWSPGGETTQTITGLSAGDYTVTVTDANGCTAIATTTVNPGTCLDLAVTATSTPTLCNGDDNGTATANVTGGSGTISYLWSPGGETTQTITGLLAGVYTVTVTDGITLCTVQSTTTVNEPNSLSTGIAITNVMCFGGNTGSLDLTVSGGTPPYTFAWTPNGETTEDIANLTAGMYTVLVTDAHGCDTSHSATIQEPSAGLDLTYSVVDVLCNGDSTGAIDISVTGGTPPYFYAWNNGDTTEDLLNVVAGTYSVTVTDSNGCTLVENNIIIDEPTNGLSIIITKENATTAQGCLDGEATATTSGGTPPYTYLWSPSAGSQTTMTATNLPSGTHTVTVTDANGCILEQGVVIDCINNCDAIITVDNIIDVLCTGDTTGSATVSASSIANPGSTFTFTWNTGDVDAGVTTSTLNNLGTGVYTVSVTIDGTVCLPVEQSVTITEPTNALNVTASATDENGPTTGDGTATASPSGGTPPYTYVWSPGGETTQTITGLSAGDYTVTVTDANGCTAMATTTVNPGTCLDLAVIASSTPTLCNGDSNGSATANVTGGSGTISYLWSPGGETTQTISNIAAGVYTVTVTDGVTLCIVQSTTTVNEPSSLSTGIAITNVACFGGNTGSLDLTVSGGTPPYLFAWIPNGETTEDLFNLTAGMYTVQVTDANGCNTSHSAAVQEPAVGLDLTYTVVDVLCNGDATGEVDITVTGGTTPYSYAWNNGATTEDLLNVVSGTYSVTVTDSNGCILVENNIIIDEPVNGLSIVITKENATTGQGCLDGEATATPSGGTPPYTYLWSPSAGSQTTMTATNLPSGTHTITVTDANGCELMQGVVIDCSNTCDAIVAIDNITNVLCTGDTTGSATVSASSIANPTATFTFTWNTVPSQVDAGVTTSTVNGLGAGVYTVSVTIDGTVCLPVEQSVTITEPTNALNVTASATDENGPTTGDGTATASPSGGTPPYTYLWSPGGETTQTITGLSAGDYTVTVTDANGCTAMATTTVNPGTCLDLAVTATSTPTLCNGDANGTATANVSGGSGTISYLWNPGGETTQTITGLLAGVYTVTVTDGITLCTVQSTTTVNEPNALSSGIAVTNVACFGDATGSLDLTVTGGTAPYSFLWTPNGETTEDLFNLVAGTYSVAITDANGCTMTNSATIMQPSAALSLTISSQTDILCSAPSSVTVLASGGTPPYLYALDGGTPQSSGTFNDLTEGAHSISALDANGCDTSIPVTILKNCTVAVDDINNTSVNVPVNGNVLTNDFDLEGDTQTVTTTTVTTIQGVVVTIDAVTGAYTYSPPANYAGEDSFIYTICDDGLPQACDTAVVYIEIVPVSVNNDPPVANADTNSTLVNIPVNGNVLPNDYDPDDDPITVTANTQPANGSVVMNPDGTYTYTPNLDFIGEDIFEYTICDNGTPPLCDTTTVTIQVLDTTNNITTAVDDSYFTSVDVPVSGNVLDNDTDPQSDNQTVDIAISPSGGPSNGIVVLNADGTFTYTPNPGYSGPDSFVYSIFDDGSPVATDSATVIILINASQNEILAIDDINNTFVNLPVDGSVATNDENPDGPAGTEVFTLVTPPVNGNVVLNPDGTYTYTPNLDYVGEDTFEYQICDGGNPIACDTAIVYIEILPINSPDNEPPVANADTNTTEVDTPVMGNVLPNDFDPDGDPITVTANTQPANGTVVMNPDGTYTYTPNPGFEGEDTFEYTICDDGAPLPPPLCDTATVTIQVIPNIGNITVANDDAYNGIADEPIMGSVLDNDNDPEGDNQTVNTTPVSGPSNGTVVLNADGTFTYTPDPGFFGTDQFVYEVCDDGTPQACDQATVYLTVAADNGNEILAIDDINNTFVNLPVDGSVATNDENPDGPAGTEVFTLVTPPVNGNVVLNPDGTYTYTPNLDYVGEDTFEYQICDGGNPIACDTAIVYIEILPINSPDNEPPVANADTNTTEVDTPVMGNVLPNDFDPDGDPITVTANTQPANGTVVMNPDGTYTYTPNPGFEGEDTFEYTICDDGAPLPPPLCDTATVTIQVIPNIGNITVANDDAYNGIADEPIMGSVLDNDNDPEGDNQTVNTTPVSGPSNGTVVLNADGTFTYTPDPGFFGTDQFVYEVCDDGTPQACDQATVYLTVAADNGNEILAIDDINNTFVNLPVDGSVATNDENPDGPAGTEVFTLVTPPVNGNVVLNPDGTYTYTPNLDYVGEDTFEYQICDGGNPIACDTAIVYIEILPINSPDNEPPVANADTNTTEVDTPVMGNVLPNDFDPDGDPITVTANTQPANGTVVMNPDGTYTYTPNPGFEGEDTFEYTICDDGAPLPPPLCDTATVTIQVIPNIGNITVANDDAYNGIADEPIMGSVLDNDNDPEGDNQTVNTTPVSGPSNGTVVLNADGTFTYTPDPGFFGTDQFVYEVCDDGTPQACDQATVYLTVAADNGNEILAIDDINNTFVNLPVDGSVATNDENPDGPAGTEVFTLVTPPVNGNVVLNPDGTYTYTPNLDYVGEDTFEYQICDGGNPIACDTAIVYIEILPINSPDNEPPVANADTNTTEVDTPVMGNVLPNDFDPDGDPITVTANTQPANGTVVMNPDGTYTYTPNPGFEGEDTFEYTICDDGAPLPPPLCDTATVTIQVIPNIGNITVANDDAYNGIADEPIMGSVLDNDNDPEGDNQTVNTTPVSGPSNGTVVLNADGTFTYTPDPGFFGTDQFVYEVCDDGTPQACDQATVYLTVAADNGNEILAIDDINNTFVNLPVDGSVATNDENPDGPAGTEVFTLVTPPVNGNVVLNPDGTYTYTPNLDYVGEDTFEYQICDGGNPIACDTAIVYIEILPINSPDNEPPVANADTNTTEVDTPVMGNVLPNDFDPDGDPITVTANTQPANGTVVMNPDGTYTYTPNPGFEGEDTFEYTICDDGAPLPPPLCDTATVTIQVIPNIGNITVANDDAYNGIADEPIMGSVLDNDNDPEGDNQTVNTTPVSGPSNGTVVLNADGTFTYTPDPGFFGTDQFVYEVCDDGTPQACDQATVYLTVAADNGNEILAIDDINNTFVNLPVDGSVATNDENPDGPAGTEVFTLVTPPVNGNVVLNPDGTYTYTPNLDYVGEDTFEYQICDGGNPIACDTAIVYIEILPINSPDNEPPVANADTNTTEVDTPVMGNVLPNDFDPDGDPITVTANTQPANGTVVMNPDGTYTYTPNPGFEGEDTFEYTICDDGAPLPPPLCDTATVTIQVIPNIGNITVANDDAYNGIADEPIMGSVLDNDNDPEGDNQTVNTTPVSGPSNGTVVLNADGTFTYTPDPGFFGTDQFVYEVCDDGTPQACDQATVYLTVAADNGNEILAIDDINNTFVNLPVDGSVATNDENPDGPAGTEVFTLVTPPSNGNVVLNPDGTYTYTPNLDYVGEDTFEYQICDGGNPIACDTAIVYIEILPINSPDNEPPVANADTNTTEVDTPVMGNVLPNDFDPDGDPITVTANTQPANGTVVMNPDGTYTYTPNPGFEGEDTFEYTICDDGAPLPPPLCDTATVTIQVIPNIGNITVANDDAYNGIADEPIMGSVLDNDNDPEGDNQTVNTTPVSGPSNGTVVLNADGTFTYTPDPGFFGTDQFVYEVCDDGTPQACDQATVYLTVAADNGNEILAIDDINNTFVNLPVDGSVATNDENPDGPAGTEVFTLVTPPSNGNVVLNPDGTYTYTPNLDYVGEDTFEYQICDGGNPIACDTAIVYIEILPINSPDNEPPVANADTNTTEVDTPVMGNVLPNDFDPDGDPITVTANTQPANGTVVMNPDGTYTYTPNPGFEGEDTFEYTICDDGAPLPPPLCDTATVTIQVIPNIGNITVANDDAYNGIADEPIMGSVLDNDNDPEGDNQTVNTTPVSGPSNGTVVLNADGTFTYTPDPGFFGTDQFVYEVCDDGTPQACDQATVYLTVAADNGNEILAIDDINNTFVNLPVDGSVATNDENPDGPAGTEVFTLVTPPVNGNVVLNPDGTYTYTPNLDYVGEDTFEYQICDGGNPIACDTAIVYIEIVDDPVIGNDPPVANADTNITEVDTPISGNILSNDFDPDGDPITVTANTQPANGTVVIDPVTGVYTYTPNPGFEGEDTFEYTICDNGVPPLCDTTIVTIQVIPNNGNITVANDDAYYGEVDTNIVGNVLDNDSDPEGDSQSVDVTLSPVSGPSNGTVIINADGTFTYTPGPGFKGTDQFVYAIFDDGIPIATDVATVYILIEETPAPAIAIIKVGTFNDEDQDGCADVDETISYAFTVANTGNVDLMNVVVTDPLVTVSGGPISLAAGATDTTTFTAVYSITQIDIDAGNVTNQATAEGADEDGTVVSDLSDDNSLLEDDPTVTTLCQEPSIALIKVGTFNDENQDGCADVDETISYVFTVANTGNVTLSNVIVTDPLVTVSGGPLATLAVGATDTTTFTAVYSITQADIDAGNVTNQATAEGTDTNGGVVSDLSDDNSLLEDDPTVTTLCQEPSIALIKVGTFNDENQDGCADVDETISYAFTVANTGNVTLSNVIVTDPLVTVSGGPLATLAVGATDTTTFTAVYSITQADIDAGNVTNQATAEGTDTNGGVVSDLSDDNSLLEDDPTVTTLCQEPSIALIKVGTFNDENQDGCADVDETISYAFTVANTGNVTLSNVIVTDPLVTVSGGPLATLAVGATDTTTFTAVYSITQADIDAGNVTNQATAEGTDTNGGVVSDLSDDNSLLEDDPTVTTLCQEPSIALIKVGTFNDENQDGCADVDETISYAFTVANTGNVTLSNVIVTDPLVTVSGGPLATLAVGATDTTTFTAVYSITQADIDAGNVTNQATAEGTDTNGGVVSDLSDDNSLLEDDPTVTTLCQEPSIALIKVGTFNDENQDGCADVDETISYAFTVANTGNVTLSNVIVTDPLVTVSGGPLATLAVGATDTTTFTAVYSITQADIDAGNVTNQATAEGTDTNGGVVSDLSDDNSLLEDDPTVTTLCQEPSIALIKVGTFNDENQDGCADVDETISYAFTVANTGNVTLSNVIVTDPLVTVSGGPLATLAVGATDTTTFTAVYSITQADIDAGNVTNQATAEGTDTNGGVVSDLSDDNSLLEDDPTVTTLCQEPSIALIKVGTFNDENQDGCADVDETISYAFTVANTGNVTLSNVIVTDPLVTVSGGPLATLAVGATDTTTFTAVYSITQADIDAGNVTNQATAEGTDTNGGVVSDLSDDNSLLEDDPTVTTLCQEPSIALIKVGTFNDENQDGCADVDETISYAFTVANTGNVTLSNVIVTDPLVTVSGGPLATLAVGATDTTTFTAVYSITQADIDAGNVTNQATAEGTDTNGGVVSDLSDDNSLLEDDPTVTTLCQEPSIALIKVGTFNDENQDGCADVDETISYAFTVANTGNVTLSNVIVTDPLVTVSGGPLATLAVGATDTTTFTAVYSITQADIDAGNVTNQATAEGTDTNGGVVSDLSDDNSLLEDDPTVTELCQNGSIALIKFGEVAPNPFNGTGCPVPGDLINYTFTVVNTGNVSLSNVFLTDPLPGIVLVGGPIALAVGETDTTSFTATYAMTQADIDAGEVVNQATATGTTPGGTDVSDLSDNDVLTEDDPTVVVICQTPFLGLVKVGTFNDENGDGCADVDETISYAFTVYNLGNVTLFDIDVTDPLVTVAGGPIDLAPQTIDGTSFTALYSITQADIKAGVVINQAIATGFTFLGAQVSDLSDDNSEFENDPTVTELCQDSMIALIKTGVGADENGNGCIDAGETINYSFNVANVGNVILTDITITDPLVSVSGGPITLAAGANDATTFTAVYTVTQADIDAGNVTNQAIAEGVDTNGNVVSDLSDDNSFLEDDPTVTVTCDPAASMSITKTGVFDDNNGDQVPQVGETISYMFGVTNTGNVTLTNITLTDALPGIVLSGGPIAVLLPGETDLTTFTATYPITQADIDALEVVNQAIGTSDEGATDESDDPNDPTDVDNNGDGEPDDPTITIIPGPGTITFEIFNGVTPNGDNAHDYFQILGIENYPNNTVQIFNRWGVLVYETVGYGGSSGSENVFRGISEGRVTIAESKELPTGTYYYILKFPGSGPDDNPGKSSYAGYLYINR